MTTAKTILRVLLPLSLGVVVTSSRASDYAARLAAELEREARAAVTHEPLLVEDLEAAVMLLEEALVLQPDSADLWRLMAQAANLAERPELQSHALQEVVRLDPADEVARWLRLRNAVDRYQLVDERIGAFERLLEPALRDRIGTPVASRLALDLALLHRRAGDVESFGRWLAEATIIDPSHREAAALATGFYGTRTGDPFSEAELMVNLLMANPADLSTHIALLDVLLEHGAFAAASRVVGWIRDGARQGRVWIDDDLLAQMSVAMWANDEPNLGLGLIENRFALLDEEARQARLASETNQPVANRGARLRQPREPLLATLVAAILDARDDPDLATALIDLRTAYEVKIATASLMKNSDELARLQLELAWVSLWLMHDGAAAQALLEQVVAIRPLTVSARLRFDGWRQVVDGEFEQAIATLTPISRSDPAARVGLALAYERTGDVRGAARELLAAAREKPGTILGGWAIKRLSILLGRPFSMSDLARRLDVLVESVPGTLDMGMREASRLVMLRVRPLVRTVDPFEPVVFEVEISNPSGLTLAIDAGGPIRPQLVIQPSVELMQSTEAEPLLAPMVIDIDRVLRLEPRQSHTITIDLRRYEAGSRLRHNPLGGASIGLSVISNFDITSNGTLVPGLFGRNASSPPTRVDGVRVNEQWLTDMIARVASDPVEARDLTLLAHAVAAAPARESGTTEAERLYAEALAAVLANFGRLDEVAQAWMLAMLPPDPTFEPIFNFARKSPGRLTRLMYLLAQRTGLEDPMLDAAMRGDDEVIRAVARMIRAPRESLDPPADDAAATLPDGP